MNKQKLPKMVFENAPVSYPRLMQINKILNTGLLAVDPCEAVLRSIQVFQDSINIHGEIIKFSDYERVILVGFGKASQRMALGVKMALGKLLTKGIIITKINNSFFENELAPEIVTLIGDHPLPGINSIESTNQIIKFIKGLNNNDLVICVISGGGSSLFTQPEKGISLNEMRLISEKLILSGADISEINAVRRQIDMMKGGGLARLVYPTRMISLILSDVIGDSLSTIASGPTILLNGTKINAWEIIDKYHLDEKVSRHIKELVETNKWMDSSRGGVDNIYQNVTNIIIGNNAQMLNEVMINARRLGFVGEVISSQIQGDSRQIGQMLGQRIRELKRTKPSDSKPICLVAGGETTIFVKGKGKGGRNLETAFACAKEIDGIDDVCFVALATDGEDGSTDSAGAIVTGYTMSRARNLNNDSVLFQERNDSYHFFDQVGGLVKTGSTGTNVNDVYLLIVY